MTNHFDFFISYARADDPAFAVQLYFVLAGQGHAVWWDKEQMPSPGQTFLHEIREAIAAIKVSDTESILAYFSIG